MVAIVTLSACSLTTEGENYNPSGATASSGEGPGSGASSSQGAGGGGAGGGGVGGAAGGGGSVDPEICFDGVDNDNNGLTDCEDLAHCAAIAECVPGLPTGFTHYVRYLAMPHTGTPLTPPSCPDGSQPVGLFSVPGDPATCGACSCVWSGGACAAPTIECFQYTATCDNGADATITALNEGCISMANFTGPMDTDSCRITTPAMPTNMGKCSASGGAMTVGLMWQEEIFICAVGSTGKGCDAGQVCAPKPAETYTGALCVEANDAVACPPGWLSEQRTGYTGGSDTRSCSPCTCATGVACAADGGYTAFDENNCMVGNVAVGTGCTNVSTLFGTTGSLKPKLASVIDGQCGTSDPMGAVVGTEPTTLCCR